ncbi:conserved hypothetical protein [Thermotomaculum hydrothermale]|uniref:SIR2-like domain-containing protein n=1 Tax=Thermotomaculum hydrothermale TaxID=981385 RepID=A0A7R6SZ42_9BACT|nr:SIR2 family protein [Thermotomaculum hydrothermale]BBB33355.1 conserved hypothetical protein [Thermotomaculum hydrothermale]
MSTDKVLLLGNGINRLKTNYSWENLLDDLIKKINLQKVIKNKKEKPFTLLFEEIAIRAMKSQNNKEIELKRTIANLVKNLKPNEFHEKFCNIGATHILTTNYDYNIENSKNENIKSNEKMRTANVFRETKYSMFRRRKCGEKFVWHIHGEADVPNSITFGHEHYVGYIQKIRNYLTTGIPRKDGENIISPFFSPNPKASINEIKNYEKYSWVDLFLGCDVHIVGFSFDYTEIDLWWLTIYKEKLRQKKENISKTVYHYIENSEKKTKQEKAKLSLLKSYGVTIKPYKLKDNSYECSYGEIIKSIQNSL